MKEKTARSGSDPGSIEERASNVCVHSVSKGNTIARNLSTSVSSRVFLNFGDWKISKDAPTLSGIALWSTVPCEYGDASSR